MGSQPARTRPRAQEACTSAAACTCTSAATDGSAPRRTACGKSEVYKFKGDVLRGRDVVCCVLAARQASNAADGRRLTDGPKFEKAVKLLALVKVSSAFVEHVFSQLAFIRRAIGDSASRDVMELRTLIRVNNGLMENYRARK